MYSLLTFFLLLGLATISSAEQPSTSPKTISFAAYDTAPWYIHSEQGPATGIIPHYTQQLTSQSEYSIDIIPMPYQRVIDSTSDKSIDFIASIEHPQLYKMAYPYIKLGKIAAVVYSSKPLDELIVAVGDAKAKVGILRGILPLVYKLAPKELTDRWDIVEVNTEESGFRAAQLGHLDAAILSRNAYEYLVNEEGGDNLGYAENIGFFTVFAWLPKRTKLNYHLIKIRNHIEELTHDGKIVLDWRTALNRFESARESRQKPALVNNKENIELRKLLNKLKAAQN